MRRVLLAAALLAVPALASAQQPETIEYYGTDALGSIRIVWDANGNVLGRQDFTPFGTPVLNATAMPAEGFVGNQSDAETQQGYFHARMFEARTGRFTRVDAVFGSLFNPQAWNRYAYSLNSPEVLSDPDGDDPITTSTNGCSQTGHAPIDYYLAGCWGQLGSGVSIYAYVHFPSDPCFFKGCYPYGPPPGYPPTTGGTGTGGTGGTGGTPTGDPPNNPPNDPPPPGPPAPPPPTRAQCAAAFGSRYSVASLLGISQDNLLGQAYLGNDVSTFVSMFAGPSKARAVESWFISSPSIPGAPTNLTALAVEGLGSIGVGRAAATLGVNGAGTYYVRSFSRAAISTLLPAAAKSVASGLALGKLGYDGATFAVGMVVCGR